MLCLKCGRLIENVEEKASFVAHVDKHELHDDGDDAGDDLQSVC